MPQTVKKKKLPLETPTRTDIAPLVLVIVYAIFGILAVAFAFLTAVDKR